MGVPQKGFSNSFILPVSKSPAMPTARVLPEAIVLDNGPEFRGPAEHAILPFNVLDDNVETLTGKVTGDSDHIAPFEL